MRQCLHQHAHFKNVDMLTLRDQATCPFNFDNYLFRDDENDNIWARRKFNSMWPPQSQTFTMYDNDNNTCYDCVNKSIFCK